MAQVAPGLRPERNEPPCYNCGIRGHMFTACPEEPRKVPAGLEASWARQQSSTSPHNDSPVTNRRNKGPVITRYPPPPLPAPSHHTPPMPRFDNSLPQPYQSGQIPVYPPPSYSTGYGGHPTSQPPYDRYGPPAPPGPPGGPPGLPPVPPPSLNPPPYHVSYNAPYGAPPPVHGSYDHPHGPPPPGTPGQYFKNDYPGPNRPGPYPPSQYPPAPSYSGQHPYPSGPPPSYPPPPPHFVNPPAPYGYNGPPSSGPPGYPQGDYGLPQHDPYQPYPPPDSSRGRPHEDGRNRHYRGRDHQHRHDDRRSSETWHSQDRWHNPSPPVDHQGYGDDYREDWHSRPSYRDDRSSRKRGHGRHMDERRRDRHDRFHPYRNTDKSDRHPRRRQQSVTTQSTTPGRTAPPADTGNSAATKVDRDREPGEIISEPVSEHGDPEIAPSAILDEDKDDEDLDWIERTIFMDPPSTAQVDPIAAPLPTQYSEDVMIPPAFDAKALKSRYITPRNIDDFAQSIRETRNWQVMQHHPAFLDTGSIRLEKLDNYTAAIQKEQDFKGNRWDRGIISHDTNRQRYGNFHGSVRHNGKHRDTRYTPDQKKRRWSDFPDDTNSYRSVKRYREYPYDDSSDDRYRPVSPGPGEVVDADVEEPPYEPSENPVVPMSSTAKALKRDVVEDTRSQDSIKDRDRLSDQDISKQQHHIMDKADIHPPTPPAHLENVPPPHSRPLSRDSHNGRSSSRCSSIGSDTSESELDDIERELLGLGGPRNSSSDVEKRSPKKFNDAAPKLKRRKQPRIEAYSRRW
ncbi:hypothetical protein GGR53DRAFT_137453 [Hypoxylon sp. FL1150]|nr:hypothetical protein GGR53DRAFT_137453 [Hypoxylon sp. FL1150]